MAATDVPCDCVIDIGVRAGTAGAGSCSPPVTKMFENVRAKR